MFTAAAIYKILNFFHITINIRNVCVFTAPFFASNTGNYNNFYNSANTQKEKKREKSNTTDASSQQLWLPILWERKQKEKELVCWLLQ
jgi:hypothetical protein